MKTILFVPGFICDTYSSIEEMSIDLNNIMRNDYNIIWLVPNIDYKYSRFKNKENKKKLKEPLYVTKLKENNISFIYANLDKFNFIKNYFILKDVVEQYQVDAVLTQFGPERFHATLISKLLGVQTIWYEHWPSLLHNLVWVKRLFYQLFVDKFLTVSYYIKSTLPNNKPVYIVHNAITPVDTGIYNKDEFRVKLGLDKYQAIILMVAAFRDDKRYDLAFEIVKKVKQAASFKVVFVFAGQGTHYEYYKKYIKEQSLEDVVKMPGHVLNIPEYFKAADINILTSLEEAFGFCLLEAMNYKLPSVCFNSGGIREVITNDVDGLLAEHGNCSDFAEKLIYLLNNPKKQVELGQNGYEKLHSKFHMSGWQKNVKVVFDNLMGENQGYGETKTNNYYGA